MTKEEAIEYLKESVVIYKNTIPKISKAVETVLNMLKEKDKEIERLDKQIDLMAEEINNTDRGYIDYCEMKIECDKKCKDCIKQCFERKVKDGN